MTRNRQAPLSGRASLGPARVATPANISGIVSTICLPELSAAVCPQLRWYTRVLQVLHFFRGPVTSPFFRSLGTIVSLLSFARKLFQEGVWENPKGSHVVRILQAWGILEATQGNWDEARKYFG